MFSSLSPSSRSTGTGRLRSGAARAAGDSPRAGTAAQSRRRGASRGPPAVIRSVDHESSRTTSTCGSAPSAADPLLHREPHRLERGAAEERRHELDPDVTVGDRTSRTTPRSTSETTGISGSGISASRPRRRRRSPCRARGRAAARSSSPPRARASSSVSRLARRDRRGRLAQRSRRRSPSSSRSRRRACPSRTARALRSLRRSVGVVAGPQPVEPHLGVHAVIGLLALDLRGEPGDAPGRRSDFRCAMPDSVGGLVEEVPRDRPRPVPRAAAPRGPRTGTPPAAGRRRARRRSCRGRAPRARRGPARGRSRSARSTRTRRPPRGRARCRSTRSRASRGRARRRRSRSIGSIGHDRAVPARSRASFSLRLQRDSRRPGGSSARARRRTPRSPRSRRAARPRAPRTRGGARRTRSRRPPRTRTSGASNEPACWNGWPFRSWRKTSQTGVTPPRRARPAAPMPTALARAGAGRAAPRSSGRGR